MRMERPPYIDMQEELKVLKYELNHKQENHMDDLMQKTKEQAKHFRAKDRAY